MTQVTTNYGHMDRNVHVTIELHQDGKRVCAQATFHEKGSVWQTAYNVDPNATQTFIDDTAEFILDNDFNFLDAEGRRQWFKVTINPKAPTLKAYFENS